MGKLTRAAGHLTEQEILHRIKSTTGFWRVQKWLVILNATVDPRPAKDIARHVGLAEQTVHNLVSADNRIGPEIVEGPGKGGRRRSLLSFEEEAEFLERFKQASLTGQVATAKEIKLALEEKLGRTIHKTTVYRMLDRHGWRKVVRHYVWV